MLVQEEKNRQIAAAIFTGVAAAGPTANAIAQGNATYGGQLHLAPPTDQGSGGQKSYTIVITVGNDRHVVDVTQGPAGT
jgi:hypothetical protein